MRKTQVMLAFAFSGFLLFAGQEVARAQEGASDAALRIWKTQSGGYATKATLRKFENGVVELQKENGSIVSLAIEKLSEADQEYVKKRTGGGKTAEDAPTTKPSEVGEKSELEIKCQYLCTEMTKGYKGKDAGGKATIAVVEFSDLSGGVTDFGRLLSEELITKLFATGKYKVIERLLLNKAIAEHKLRVQGLIDPKSAKELGKILGVDAIVSGTIADVGDSLRVNARLISTETGEVLSVAAATIVKDDAVKKILTKAGGMSPESTRNRSSSYGRGSKAIAGTGGRNPRVIPSDTIHKMLQGVSLTDEQRAKAQRAGRELDSQMSEAVQKLDVLTEDQKEARNRAAKRAKEAGRSAMEIHDAGEAAVQLTDEQETRLAEAKKEIADLEEELSRQVMSLLTPEQREQARRHRPPSYK